MFSSFLSFFILRPASRLLTRRASAKNAQVDFLDAVNVNLLAVSESANLDPAMLEAASSLLREGLRGGGGRLSEK